MLSGWGIPINATISYGSTFYPILEITNAYIKFRATGVTNNQVFTVSDSLGNAIPCSTACKYTVDTSQRSYVLTNEMTDSASSITFTITGTLLNKV